MSTQPIQLTTIELFKENMKFSVGHFTIFSATERERLHGHNFNVSVSITAEVNENGMCFDYSIYKRIVEKNCKSWNEYFVLPTRSPYLTLREDGKHIYALFNEEQIPFLKSDVLLLDIRNATVEEFSDLIVRDMTANKEQLSEYKIHALEVKVFSGPGQSASAKWSQTPHSVHR